MRSNRLLAALDPQTRNSAGLEKVPLELRTVLHERNRAIEHVYFPTNGVVSLVNEPEDGQIVEFGTVGNEGMAGIPIFLGANTMPSRAIVQVPGEGFRMGASQFLRLLDQQPQFHAVLMRYTLALLTHVAQAATCNRLHEVQERCARWLLHTHDRMDGDTFTLTQEFLAQMLGVHRPTVSIAAGMLQNAGLIKYARGAVTVLDREGLQKAACNCYKIIINEYDRLLDHPHG